MKRLYWRPQKASWKTVFGLALFAALGLAVVERNQRVADDPLLNTKLDAARLADRAMQTIRRERLRQGHAIDPQLDPTESGMIGQTLTPVTSVSGHLASKQTSINPNFAAAVVDMLGQAGVQPGDAVAVGCSGSFPALNLAVYTAMETLGAKPIVICSVAGSQFGANIPDLMWPDMERLLHAKRMISFRAVAASLGGYEDRAAGMSDEGKRLIREVIQRNDLTLIESSDYQQGLEQRMVLYDQHAGGRPIKAYVNVGGGTVSVGRSLGKHLYLPGLNLQPPAGAADIDSVMTRFARRGAAIIHLVQARDLAKAYGFPSPPAVRPKVGAGNVYGKPTYNRWLAAAVLLLILASLRAFVLTPTGTHCLAFLGGKLAGRKGHPADSPDPPRKELMV